MIDAARNGSEYQMRRRVWTCHRMRTDSANDGGISSVPITSAAAPAAARSKWPRPGSMTRRPRYANTRVTGTNTKKGARQPKNCAIRPPRSGPANAPSASPIRWKPNTSARTSGGYMSGMSELCVGVTTARPMPEPERASTSIQTLTAAPVKMPNTAHTAAPITAMRMRGSRSA